jgi:hypothetical protein
LDWIQVATSSSVQFYDGKKAGGLPFIQVEPDSPNSELYFQFTSFLYSLFSPLFAIFEPFNAILQPIAFIFATPLSWLGKAGSLLGTLVKSDAAMIVFPVILSLGLLLFSPRLRPQAAE